MKRDLIRPDGGYDRRAIMAEAHHQFRLTRGFGWSFGRCLSFAWKKAQAQRGRLLPALMPEVRPRRTPPIIGTIALASIAQGRQPRRSHEQTQNAD